jgi:hypothetical protein
MRHANPHAAMGTQCINTVRLAAQADCSKRPPLPLDEHPGEQQKTAPEGALVWMST